GDRRLKRIEGEAALGESFALRATVAYKGTWIRLTRTFSRDGAARPQEEAAARLAAAVAKLPSAEGFAGFSSWLVEGCRIAQPLAPLMGSCVTAAHLLAPRALVSVQADFEIEGRPLLLGAPALVGGRGEAGSLLVRPFETAFGARGVLAAAVRACKAIAIIAAPPNSMLMPTSNPSAHSAVPGSPAQMMAARMRSIMPLTSIQPHCPESSFLCSKAYMIERMP